MLALALALLLAVPDTVGPAPGARDLDVSLRTPITTLYSGEFGFGIAAGLRARSGATTATLDGRLSQHWQGAALTVDTHNPATARVFGRVRGVASSVSRWRYHGLGSATDADTRADLDLGTASAVAAVGVRPLASRVLTVQPEVGVRIDRLDALADDAAADLFALPPADQQAFFGSAEQTRRAGWLGLTAEVDTRDRIEYPSQGAVVSAGARRLAAFDDSDFGMMRYDARAAGFVPLGQRVTLFGRASASVARADDGAEIPLFYLPTVDPDLLAGFPLGRFRGRDTALFSVGTRIPIIDALGTFGLDATVTASAGNAYRDLFSDFSPTLSTGPTDHGTASLRPVLGLGLALVNIPKGRVAFGGTLGLGPEGTTLFAFRLATGLGDDLPVLW